MIENWACEENYLIQYLEQIRNPEAKKIEKSEAFFMLEKMADDPGILEIGDTEATIKIAGMLSKNGPSMLARLFGFEGTAYLDILEAIAEVAANESIETVRLAMDTPGGEVNGVDQVWAAVAKLAKEKKVIAENLGLIASAGYWIASAASEIKATSPTAETGSIGVVLTQTDYSEMDKRWGIRTITVLSKNAPNKRPDATTSKGLAVFQERVDAIERIFIARIAAGRGLPESDIEKNFGRGALLVAQDPNSKKPDAIKAKMIDGLLDSTPIVKTVKADLDAEPESKHLGDLIIDAVEAHIEKPESGENITPGQSENQSHIDTEAEKAEKYDQTNKTESAEAGKGKDQKMATLADLIRENPEAAEEIEQIKADAEAKGSERIEARIKKASPILNSEKYPAAVKALAIKVLEGDSEPAALEGACTMFDAQQANEKTDQSIEDTEDAGETPPQSEENAPRADGVIETEADYQAALSEHRAAQGAE
jgi:ClpP class serine protease